MTQNIILMTITLIAAVSFVNTQTSDDLQPHNHPLEKQFPSLTRARRMYALCPPQFQKIGNDCYYISIRKESWLDAHFECKDRNSKLAEPLKFADRRLRKFLKNKDRVREDKWIGGMYNWQQNKWQWGYNGGEMKHNSFADKEAKSDLRYHCTTMDPATEYKWSAKLCTERHYYICQHRMSYVNDKNRQRVYTKWNETYPNQLANEVEVYVSTNANRNRSVYRNVPKRNRINKEKSIQLYNQLPKAENSDNVPDYLPYSAYNNIEQLKQKVQEDTIHPLHASNPRQPPVKPRKRHSRPLQLTGEVNLGFKSRNREKKLQKSVKPVEVVTNAGRHHHHPNDILQDPTTTMEVLTDQPQIIEVTTQPPIVERTTKSEAKRKLQEKAERRERLRQKLKALSPEERQAFLLMKQQRADAKKKGLNYH
ncbi:CLUMA_CG009526, isoform A [Clunio marinus]|uniref:CLUMA_CG009526, isoform A n=1 Tax=Clunio marinus TaxID=568069 RepID=A0A1J1I8P7_9DIPT|nr:CLUMA_CG009526, isoform A [Clunio marinus]